MAEASNRYVTGSRSMQFDARTPDDPTEIESLREQLVNMEAGVATIEQQVLETQELNVKVVAKLTAANERAERAEAVHKNDERVINQLTRAKNEAMNSRDSMFAEKVTVEAERARLFKSRLCAMNHLAYKQSLGSLSDCEKQVRTALESEALAATKDLAASIDKFEIDLKKECGTTDELIEGASRHFTSDTITPRSEPLSDEVVKALMDDDNRAGAEPVMDKVRRDAVGKGGVAAIIGKMPDDEPNLDKCPECGGPADNGFSRDMPPEPYVCKACSELALEEPNTSH